MRYRTLRGPTTRYCVPAAAVLRHVREWQRRIEAAGHDHQCRARPGEPCNVPLTSTQILAERTGQPHISRVLWRLENEVEYVTVDTADVFITAIDPSLWHTDPDLAAAYADAAA